MLRLLARLPTRTTAVAGRALQRRNMAGSTWEYALKHGHHPVRSRDSRTRFLFLSLPAPALVSSLRPARCSQPPLSAPRNAASFSFNTCARLRSRTPSHYHPIALPPPTHTFLTENLDRFRRLHPARRWDQPLAVELPFPEQEARLRLGEPASGVKSVCAAECVPCARAACGTVGAASFVP